MQEKVESTRRVRRLDLDRAKGLGIVLVVLGHIVARTPPRDNEWFGTLTTVLYEFHMPFFMYLSGYVTFLSGAARTPLSAWPRFVVSRAYRLLLPFLIFGLAIVIGKFCASRFMQVDNLPASFMHAVTGILWDTDYSPAASVWYIAVLFIFCVITPVLLALTRGNTAAVLAIAALFYYLNGPHVMYLDRVAIFYPFFLLGGVAADAGERWLSFIDRFRWMLCGAFVLVLLVTFGPSEVFLRPEKLLICGILSMPALHSLVRSGILSRSRALLTLGMLSFSIYLLNTPCIGIVKGLMLKLISWDGLNFLIFAPCLLAAGLLGPILIKRKILRHLAVLDRITN